MPLRRSVVLIVALALAGAAGRAGAADSRWQTLANQATDAFTVGPVQVDERDRGPVGLYVCREMRIQLLTVRAARLRLDAADIERRIRGILAHELGHHLRRHCGQSPTQEMEANAGAVAILELWGASRADALAIMARQLHANLAVVSQTGHDVCGELLDFLSRFPMTPDLRKPGECGA